VPDSPPSLFALVSDFPLFVLRLFTHPRSLVRGSDWNHDGVLGRTALYVVAWLLILTFAFGTRRMLAGEERVLLNSFKGIVMRAHDRSWEIPPGAEAVIPPLAPVYRAFKLELGEAKRLWDNILTPRFLAYTFLAGLLAMALIARLRMWRFGLTWEQALGTGMLSYCAVASCAALSLVPLALLFVCRHCGVRLALFILLNIAAWAYAGYYTLGDLGERPRGAVLLFKSLGYGLLQYALTYVVFFVLMLCVLPI
jgi:hypothetical protein